MITTTAVLTSRDLCEWYQLPPGTPPKKFGSCDLWFDCGWWIRAL